MDKKIIEITLEEPSLKSGGGIGILQSIKSLINVGSVLYVGPNFDRKLAEVDKKIELSHKYKLWDATIGMLQGITTGYYSDWRRIYKRIPFAEYDVLYVEFTRYPFVIPPKSKFSGKTIVRVHNIEYDYFKNLLLNKKNVKNFLRFIIYKHAERKTICKADILICLTEADKNRLVELYNNDLNGKRIFVNPVSIDDRFSDVSQSVNERVNKFLITGSLWYGPNLDGLTWFIENVWKKMMHIEKNDTYRKKLIIAGSKPSPKLREIIGDDKSIELTVSPECIDDFFRFSDYYIAPVFTGAGMKVKIAEAMMFGLPIVASSHALIGYSKCEGIFEADTDEEFIEVISRLSMLTENEKISYKNSIRNNYLKNYSIKSSGNRMREIMEL